MTALGEVFARQVRAKVGHVQHLVIPEGEPDVAALFRLFPSNADIARAAGLGTAAEVPGNRRRFLARESFMRDLRRYRARVEGTGAQSRSPRGVNEQRIAGLARSAQRGAARPRTIAQVLDMMRRFGTTTDHLEVDIKVSDDVRRREVEVNVYVAPEVYDEVGWPAPARTPRTDMAWDFFATLHVEAWSIAYGIPGAGPVDFNDEDEPVALSFAIGRAGGIAYDYT